MKKSLFSLLFLLAFATGFAQVNKLIAIDSVGLGNEVEDLVRENLSALGIEYPEYLNFLERCAYHYVYFTKQNDELQIVIKDCADSLLGQDVLHRHIWLANSDQRALEISKRIAGILRTDIAALIKAESKSPGLGSFKNHHDSRYFFAPSAYNIRKGQLYYNTNYFLIHDLQYGISDNFSIGMGTSVAAFPLYLTPKFSFKINEKHALAAGDLFIIGTYGTNFNVNLAYGTYTYGSSQNNVSLGLAALHSSEFVGTNPVFNLNAMLSLSKYTYFITENYFAPNLIKNSYTTESYNPLNGERLLVDQGKINQSISAGFMGLRLINKRRDVMSWQFGMLYFVPLNNVKMDDYSVVNGIEYYTQQDWSFPNFLIIPNVSFTLKFGRSY